MLFRSITLTTSLLYSSLIAISAPIGPLIGLWIADKFERKSVIVATAAAIVVCGLTFSQLSDGMLLIAMGVGLTLASNIMSYSFHAYQTELFPTGIRSTAVGFVYSWSRFSAIFTSFAIAGVPSSMASPTRQLRPRFCRSSASSGYRKHVFKR